MSTRRTLALTLALTASAMVAVAPPVLGAGWTSPFVLRTGASGVPLDVGDIAGTGDAVVVGWQETPPGGAMNVRVRWSTDRGAAWSATERLDTRPQREVQVDACGGSAWAVSSLQIDTSPNTWAVALDGHDLDAGIPHESSIVTTSGVARKPDIACAGTKRLAVAWFASTSSGYHVKLFSRGVILDLLGTNPPEIRRDLGSAAMKKGLAVAASASRIYVAWFAGNDLRLKRYDLGPAPRYTLTEHPTQTVAAGIPYGLAPELGVAGSRVLLAYTNRASLYVRTSSDGGASWSGPRRLIEEPFPSEVIAIPTNADVTGTRMLVSGYEVGGDAGGVNGAGFIEASENAGGAWSMVSGSQKVGGTAVGAFVGSGAGSRQVQAWDETIADPAVEHIRFHRES
ncbi:MAG: hypothetical protein U0869_26105 [Chloroflexota bacterium]